MTETKDGTQDEVAFPVASFDDPHLEPLARDVKRAEGVAGLFLMVGLAGFIAFGVAYWQNWSSEWLAATLGTGLFCFGFGMSAWGKYLLPQGPFVEERHSHASTEEEVEAMAAAVVGRGKLMFRRRGFLGGILGAGAGAMGIVMAFPLVRSLGPIPKKTFEHTHWTKGTLVVDITGRPVMDGDVEVGGQLTVFPQGHEGDDMDQTLLIRPYDKDITTKAGRETWAPNGNLAFSKVCTHAGCPVGLYEEQTQQLLCPCHQSLFNVGPPPGAGTSQGQPATPVFGPAPRPLPQLPLMIVDGYLVAQSDYEEPVGPGYFERTS